MFRCIAYKESLQEDWDRLALAHGSVFHTTAFRRILLTAFGYRCCYHAVVDEMNRICALLPLVAGRNLGLKQAGVALPFINHLDICAQSAAALQFAVAALPKVKADCGLDYLELRLKDQELQEPGWHAQLHNVTFTLPLGAGEEQVLAMSSSSNRNHVRKAYKNNWFTASFDSEHLEAFYRVYVRRMKQLGSPAPDIQFFYAFFQYLPEHAFLLTVLERETGAVVGGMLLVASPGDGTLYYPYGANLIEYNSKYLNNFMYWEAIKFGISKGLKYLDLGRSPLGSGTYRYKEQWGARAEQLKYLVYADGNNAGVGAADRDKLKLFIDLWKIAPACLTDFAGGKLIKYLFP